MQTSLCVVPTGTEVVATHSHFGARRGDKEKEQHKTMHVVVVYEVQGSAKGSITMINLKRKL